MYKFIKNILNITLQMLGFEGGKSLYVNYLIEQKYPQNKNNLEEERFKKKIIEQAHRDAGFQGPIFMRPSHTGWASISFFSTAGRSTLVEYPNDIKNQADEVVYALSGKEAVHSLHCHSSIKFAPILFIHHPLAFVVYFFTLRPQISKLCEVDADITSSKRLNTANLLIKRFEEHEKRFGKPTFYKRMQHFLISPHPSRQARINYLKPLSNNSPCHLFKSEHYLNLKKEKVNQKQDLKISR